MSRISKLRDVYTISPDNGDFQNIETAIAWLGTGSNMTNGTLLKVSGGAYNITDTITVDLAHPLKIQGACFSITSFNAATGLATKPMFIFKSDCDITKCSLDASTLANYGTQSGENGINIDTDDTYHEIKDAGIYGFNKGLYITSNSEFWVFESEINDCAVTGVEINTASTGSIYRSAETDYSNNASYGINLVQATDLYFSSENDTTELTAGQTFINYDGTNVTYTTLVVKGAIWNEVGTFRSGFDFTLARDADIEIMYNVGTEDTKPHCKINLANNTTVTSLTDDTWAKATFTNTSSYTKKWTIADNQMTYESSHVRDVLMILDGNVVTTQQPVLLTYGIVKNGNSAVRYGENTIYLDQNNRAFSFGTNVYLEDVAENDYFELWIMNSSNNGDATVQDLNWFASVL